MGRRRVGERRVIQIHNRFFRFVMGYSSDGAGGGPIFGRLASIFIFFWGLFGSDISDLFNVLGISYPFFGINQ